MATKTQFQSTRPVRGATWSTVCWPTASPNFNPRAPCGARPIKFTEASSPDQFQSTRPVRGATWRWISSRPTTCYFNPRAPCGARHCQSQGH